MLDAQAIHHSFEAEKNRKVLTYTTVICALFLVIAIFYTWPMQVPPVPTMQDLIDVNLGNAQEGSASQRNRTSPENGCSAVTISLSEILLGGASSRRCHKRRRQEAEHRV